MDDEFDRIGFDSVYRTKGAFGVFGRFLWISYEFDRLGLIRFTGRKGLLAFLVYVFDDGRLYNAGFLLGVGGVWESG